MVCEAFIEYRPQAATRRIIDQANAIIAQYLDQGLKLTLRQLFYQFVARALLENVFRNYKRLGWIVASARDGGLIDWDAMEDRTREVHTHSAWDDPSAMIRTAAYSYVENLWRNQRYRPEVWIEKSALLGVVEGASAREVMQLVMVTQYFDTLKSIGETDKTNTLFLSHSPGTVKEIGDQILESMLSATQAKTGGA